MINGEGRSGRVPFLLMRTANPADGSESVIGPATVFRAVGGSLRFGPAGQEAAYFRDGLWRRRNIRQRFSLLWTEACTDVRMENTSTGERLEIGTFEMVGIVCDMIYVDREHSQPIACLDETSGQWRYCRDGTLWPEVVLLPCPRVALSWGEPVRARREVAASYSAER